MLLVSGRVYSTSHQIPHQIGSFPQTKVETSIWNLKPPPRFSFVTPNSHYNQRGLELCSFSLHFNKSHPSNSTTKSCRWNGRFGSHVQIMVNYLANKDNALKKQLNNTHIYIYVYILRYKYTYVYHLKLHNIYMAVVLHNTFWNKTFRRPAANQGINTVVSLQFALLTSWSNFTNISTLHLQTENIPKNPKSSIYGLFP